MNRLTLFSQVSINSRFRFESADKDNKVFIKTSNEDAHHDGTYQPINPGVLVFTLEKQTDEIFATGNASDLLETK